MSDPPSARLARADGPADEDLGGRVGYFTVINWLFATAVLCMLLDPKVLPGMDAKLGLPGGFMTALFCVFLVT